MSDDEASGQEVCAMRGIRFVALVVALLPVAAEASVWHRVSRSTGAIYYIDVESARSTSDSVTVWEYVINATSTKSGVKSAKVRTTYDCNSESFRTLHYVFYDVKGDVISSERSQTSYENRFPVPDTVSETIFNFVCKDASRGIEVADPMSDAVQQFSN